MISDRVIGRLEYAEQYAAMDAEAARAELVTVEHACDELKLMITRRHGGAEQLAIAARDSPIALELQQRFQANVLRRTELRRRVGRE